MILANHKNENIDTPEISETHLEKKPKKKRLERLDTKQTTANPNKTTDFVSKFLDNPTDTRYNRNLLPTIQKVNTDPT